MRGLNYLGSHGVRVDVGPKHESGTGRRLLEHMEINCAVGGLANVVELRVSHHTHDFVALVITIEGNALSDWIAIREIVTRHGLIDDGHQRTALVAEVKVAPGQQRSA